MFQFVFQVHERESRFPPWGQRLPRCFPNLAASTSLLPCLAERTAIPHPVSPTKPQNFTVPSGSRLEVSQFVVLGGTALKLFRRLITSLNAGYHSDASWHHKALGNTRDFGALT